MIEGDHGLSYDWTSKGIYIYICSRTDHGLHCFLNFYSIKTCPQPLMTVGVVDDDNLAFAVLLYSYIIAREEEDKQQTDQLQPQPQRARRAAVRQFGCDHGSERRGEIYGHENS